MDPSLTRQSSETPPMSSEQDETASPPPSASEGPDPSDISILPQPPSEAPPRVPTAPHVPQPDVPTHEMVSIAPRPRREAREEESGESADEASNLVTSADVVVDVHGARTGVSSNTVMGYYGGAGLPVLRPWVSAEVRELFMEMQEAQKMGGRLSPQDTLYLLKRMSIELRNLNREVWALRDGSKFVKIPSLKRREEEEQDDGDDAKPTDVVFSEMGDDDDDKHSGVHVKKRSEKSRKKKDIELIDVDPEDPDKNVATFMTGMVTMLAVSPSGSPSSPSKYIKLPKKGYFWKKYLFKHKQDRYRRISLAVDIRLDLNRVLRKYTPLRATPPMESEADVDFLLRSLLGVIETFEKEGEGGSDLVRRVRSRLGRPVYPPVRTSVASLTTSGRPTPAARRISDDLTLPLINEAILQSNVSSDAASVSNFRPTFVDLSSGSRDVENYTSNTEATFSDYGTTHTGTTSRDPQFVVIHADDDDDAVPSASRQLRRPRPEEEESSSSDDATKLLPIPSVPYSKRLEYALAASLVEEVDEEEEEEEGDASSTDDGFSSTSSSL